jgi:hypothetical protein
MWHKKGIQRQGGECAFGEHSGLEALGGEVIRGGGTTHTGELLNKHTEKSPWSSTVDRASMGMPISSMDRICSEQSRLDEFWM